MSEDGAPLPDSDDPFVLLAIDPGADTRTIKRAHARLIRRFRPDRDPESFKRVQAAYELALRWAKMKVRFVVRDAEDVDTDAGAEATSPSPSEATTTDDPPREAATKLWPREVPASRELSPAAWILEGIRQGARFEIEAFESLEREAFVRVATDPGCSWAQLERLPQRELATSLFRERMEQYLVHDALAEAVRELRDMREALLREPELEFPLRVVIAAATWRDPERAHLLARELIGADNFDEQFERLEDLRDEIERIAPLWAELRRRPMPPALTHFVELNALLSRPLRRELREALRAEFRRDPHALAHTLARADALDLQDPESEPRARPSLVRFMVDAFLQGSPLPAAPELDAGTRARIDATVGRSRDAVGLHQARAQLVKTLSWIVFCLAAIWLLMRGGYRPGLLAIALLVGNGRRLFEARHNAEVHQLETQTEAELLELALSGQIPPGALTRHLELRRTTAPTWAEHWEALDAGPRLEATATIAWAITHWARHD